MTTCLSGCPIKPIVTDCVMRCSFKQKHIVHIAAQLMAHCLALFSRGLSGTWFNKSWEPLEGDFLLLNQAFTHMYALWCHQPDPGAQFLCPQECRHGSASRIITAWSVQSKNLWQECWVLAKCVNIQYMCGAFLVWMDCTETHTEPLWGQEMLTQSCFMYGVPIETNSQWFGNTFSREKWRMMWKSWGYNRGVKQTTRSTPYKEWSRACLWRTRRKYPHPTLWIRAHKQAALGKHFSISTAASN